MRLPRTMGGSLVVIAFVISAVSHPGVSAQTSPGEQERAIAAIEKLGGEVERFWTGGVHGVDLSRASATDAELVHLRAMSSVLFLDFTGTRVTDAGLVHLEGMKDLRRLKLGGTRITDAGLAHLKDLPESAKPGPHRHRDHRCRDWFT